MFKLSFKLVLVVALSFSVSAQKHDPQVLEGFNGTWILDEKKSFNTSKARKNVEDYMLVISSEPTAITIAKSYLFRGVLLQNKIKLFPDSRGETNKYTLLYPYRRRRGVPSSAKYDVYVVERVDLDSKTSLKKGKIVRRGTVKHPEMVPFVEKQTYKLSKDKKTLTVTTETTYLKIGSFGTSLGRNPSSFGTRPSSLWKFTFRKKE